MHDRIREVMPDCAVSSDFIVGHPGETESEFEKSIDLVRRCRFKNSFIFKYSPRPGTKAFEHYADEVPEDVKRRRNNILLNVQNEISEEDNAAFIGRDVEVLVEGPSKSTRKAGLDSPSTGPMGDSLDEGDSRAPLGGDEEVTVGSNRAAGAPHQLVGRTPCDRIVVFDGNPRLAGTLAKIVIHDCTATTLIGSIVTRELQHGSNSLLPILA